MYRLTHSDEASLWKFADPTCVRLIREGIELPRHCMDNATQVGINCVD